MLLLNKLKVCGVGSLLLPTSAKGWRFGKSENELFWVHPVLLFLLIDDWPNIIEFCVPCTAWYVGLSFWPLALLNCEKWFSTISWFIIAGFIVDPGKRPSFVWTIEIKPCTMDWRSNHNFSDMKWIPLSTWYFQSEKNSSASSKSLNLGSFTWYTWCLLENNSIIELVCFSSARVWSSSLGSFPTLAKWFL